MEEVALALVLLSACDPTEPSSFGDREFLFESIEGHELLPGTGVRMSFSDEHGVTANAGCNTISALSYSLSDGKLILDEVGATEIGCEPVERHEQDEWLEAFLEGLPAYVLEEPRLTLSDDDVTLVLVDSEVADPDRTLTGRVWDVNGLIVGGLVGFGQTPQPATLEFGDDGTLAIMTSCAPGTAMFSVDGPSITLSGVSIDAVACPDDEVAVMIDAHMRDVLADGVVEHEIDAGRLTLTRGDIGLWLTTE